MIEIKKGKEPPALIAYRKTKYATYDDMPKAVHDAVLDSLMQEQGYLCAYCMRRIPQKGKTPSATIEHWDPQSKTCTDKALDYRNMLAVCNGNRGCGSKEYMTCDAKRGNTPLTVYPLNPLTLSSIQYKSDGRIFSPNSDINTDLDVTLNPHFSVKISIPLENTGVSSVFAASVWPFSLIFSLARRNEGNFFQAVPTTLSSSLAEVRLASLVAWA